jgi:recombination DNA repair RAD52 pathway protein
MTEFGINKDQYEQLLKPLNPTRVAKRAQAGRQLSYLESWDVKAHLIRIFGFGGWSWNVLTAELAFEEKNEKGQWSVGYKVIGRLYISQLGCDYSEAAIGSSSQPQRGEAHDMAIKTAESDALKRAAINLGTQFGLSLYNDGSLNDVVIKTLDTTFTE